VSRSSFHVLCALLAALAVPAAPLRAQLFQGQVTYDVTAQGQTMRMVHFIKDSNVRMEMGMQGMSMVVLTDVTATRQIILLPDTKQWIDVKAMNERMSAAMGGRMGRGGAAPATPGGPMEIRPTGRTETVVGIECEHVSIVGEGFEADVCAAKGMGWHGVAAPSMGGMGMGRGRGMGGMPGGETPAGISPEQMAVLRERFADGFFPLKMTSTRDGQTATIEVVSLERGNVDDALFRPPSDYQEIRMPGGSE
jgi:hypothetical protein